MLAHFMSSQHKLQLTEKRKPQLRNTSMDFELNKLVCLLKRVKKQKEKCIHKIGQ